MAAELRWLTGGGLGRVDAVYVELGTTSPMPGDVLLLALARLAGKRVGIYFRDAYQLFRDDYPLAGRRAALSDTLWRSTLPLVRLVASVAFTPSAGLAKALGLRRAIPLPPGADPSLPDLGAASEPVVGYVGGLNPSDGWPTLLAAMELVRTRVPDARLLVVAPNGPAILRDSAPAWVEAHAGGRDLVTSVLGHARICVIARPITRYTSFAVPVKLVEYLSYGKPIVATAADATADVIRSSGGGLTCGGSTEELAAAIERLLVEPGLAESCAAAARGWATSGEHDWAARARTILAQLGIA